MWSFGATSQETGTQGNPPLFGGSGSSQTMAGDTSLPWNGSGFGGGFTGGAGGGHGAIVFGSGAMQQQQQQQQAQPQSQPLGGFGASGGASGGVVFGSGAMQQQQQSQPQSQPLGGFGASGGASGGVVFGSGAMQQGRGNLGDGLNMTEEDTEPFDFEKSKMEALQSIPKFAGSKSQHDEGDLKKKKERAARFSTTSTAAIEARKAQVYQESASSSEKKAIVGTCEEMCPAAERERRQNMSDIQIFERLHPDNPNETSAELAVKRFARTVDDPHPSDFRTRGALERTMAYLRKLLDREDVRFGLVHKFLWDRYRSVRQDLYIQGITDQFAIRIFEEIVRFHVLCEHELCGEDQSVTDMEGFNSHLNMEQMNKALISLNDMYEKAADKGEYSANEAEFRSYHLLSLMSQHGKFKGDQQGFLSTLQSLRQDVRDSSSIQWVLQLRSAFAFGNFARFFSLIKQSPYLLACLSHIYFPQMRAKCLRIMSETVTPGRPVPLEASWLVRVLLLDSEEEALDLAKLHGFESSLDDHSVPTVLLVKGDFVPLPTPIERHPSRLISNMAPGKRSECVLSCSPMPDEQTQKTIAQRMKEAQEAQEAHRIQQEKIEKERLEKEEQERLHRAMKERQELERREKERREKEEILQREQELQRQRKEMEERIEKERIEKEKALKEEALRREALLKEEIARREREEKERLEILERKRREEEIRLAMKRKAEEERKIYLIGKLKEAIICKKYWEIWLTETRSRLVEKERLRKSAMNLKGCRVGAALRHERKRISLREDNCSDGFSPMKKQAHLPTLPVQEDVHDKRLYSIADLVEPILCEKNPNAAELFWKITIASLCDNFSNDDVARYLHAIAAFDGSCTVVPTEHNGELVYQQSGSLNVCMHFASHLKISVGCLLDHFTSGSSALVITTPLSKLESMVLDLKKTLASVTSECWKGPSIPILIVSVGPESKAFIEHGFHVRVVSLSSLHDRRAIEDGIVWAASSSPMQPSFTVTSLKQSISQGVRSFINPLRTNQITGLKFLTLLTPQDAAVELVVKAIETSFKSAEASWKWPPSEFDCGPINNWYDPKRYMHLIRAVRAIYSELSQIPAEQQASLTLLSINSLLDTALQSCGGGDPLVVIPESILSKGEFERILELDIDNISFSSLPINRDGRHRVSVRSRDKQHVISQGLKEKENRSDAVCSATLRSKVNSLAEDLNLEKMLASVWKKPSPSSVRLKEREDQESFLSRMRKLFRTSNAS